jgi:HrpA-like RNA helicase
VVAIAQHVAAEAGCELGQEVGYRIGQKSLASNATHTMFTTAGLLLEELRSNVRGRAWAGGVGVLVAAAAVPDGSKQAHTTHTPPQTRNTHTYTRKRTHNTQGAAALKQYRCLVMDELHERSVESDLMLACLHALMSSGELPTLKLVLMSATANVERYQ